MVLFTFAASKAQFEIPINPIVFSLSFESYSKFAWRTFRGLSFDFSANPNSSKIINEIGKWSFLFILFLFAFSFVSI